jgi:hypothetical protein
MRVDKSVLAYVWDSIKAQARINSASNVEIGVRADAVDYILAFVSTNVSDNVRSNARMYVKSYTIRKVYTNQQLEAAYEALEQL